MKKAVGEKKGKGTAPAAPQRESAGSCVWRLFSFAGRNLGGGLRGGFGRLFPVLQVCLSGSWSPRIGQWQGRRFFRHCSWFRLQRPPGLAVFLDEELKHT